MPQAKLSKSLLQQREHSKLSMPWLTARCEGLLFDWSRRRCACFEGTLGIDLGVEGQGRRTQVMVDGSGKPSIAAIPPMQQQWLIKHSAAGGGLSLFEPGLAAWY